MTINLAFVVWMMKSAFDYIPEIIDEAAKIDGCSEFSAFWRIILPLSTPGLASSAIISLMFTWNEYLYANSLSEYNAVTLPVTFTRFIGWVGIAWAEMCATSVVTILPIVILAMLVQKYLVKGLTMGADH